MPVGIRGTRFIQHPKSFAIHPGTVVVTYGAPIDAAEFGLRRKRELSREVRRRIAGPAGLRVGDDEEGRGRRWYAVGGRQQRGSNVCQPISNPRCGTP